MARQEFDARLESVGPGGAWTYLLAPFRVEEVFGSKARVAVKGTINGFAFRSSLSPMGDGTHALMVNKAMKAGANAAAGDTVHLVLEKDDAPRTVIIPQDLQRALAKDKAAKGHFAKLAYSHQKEYVDWIESAKKEETRQRRIEKAVTLLAEGQKLK
jgi:hypothetical protein